MKKSPHRFKKNLPLIIVALITAALFIYPYIHSGSSSPKEKNEKNQSAIPVEVSLVIRGDLNQQYKALGVVQGQKEVPVLSQVDGVLQQVFVKIGSTVRKGQSLAKLDTRLIAAELQQARTQLAQSTSELNRAQALVDRKLATMTRLQTAISQRATDLANVNRLNIIRSFANFPSPTSGIISDQKVFAGNTVQAGTQLFTIADVSRLIILVYVPEAVASGIKAGNPVTITAETTPTPLLAKVLRVYPTSDVVSHQVGIEIDAGPVFPQIKPGFQVSVSFATEPRKGVLLIDRRAISEDPNLGEVTIFTIKDGKAVRQSIKTGLVLDDQVEVLAGLSGGEAVVTKGLDRLKDGSEVIVIPKNNN